MEKIIKNQLFLAFNRTGQHEIALALAKQTFEKNPDDPMAAFVYSRALLATKRLSAARAVMEKALPKNQSPEVKSLRNTEAWKMIDEETRARIEQLPEAMARAQKYLAAKAQAQMAPKKNPFSASVQVGITSCDNLPAISDELAPKIPRREDTGKFWNLDLGYNFRNDRSQRVDLGVSYYGNDYNNLHQYETDYLSAMLAWRIHGKRHQWRFIPSVGQMELGNRDYLHNWGMEVGYIYRQAKNRWIDANIRGRWNEYQITPGLAREDRDGQETRLFVSQNWRETTRTGLNSTYGIGIFAARADTDGADYDSDKMGLRLYVRRELSDKLSFYGSYTYENRDHDNPSARSATNQSRDDRDHQTYLRLDHRFDANQSVFMAFQDSLNDSNIANSFAYRSRTWTLGYNYDF
ncbi:MAG: porin family protein [Candidatus Rifleibacteriota bacterium]